MRNITLALAAAALSLLAACSSEAPPGDISFFWGGQSGLRVSASLAGGEEGGEKTPAALAGIESVLALSRMIVLPEAPLSPLPNLGERGGFEETAADINLLQHFIEILSIDIRDRLNRSADRTEALNAYVALLQTAVQRGEVRLRALRNAEDDKDNERRSQRRRAEDLENEFEEALSAGEGTSASSIMEDLLERQTTLARAETEFAVSARLADALEEVLQPSQERLQAIKENRDALISGVKVVDIPGIEELGIIEVKEGVRRIRSRSRRGGVFGGF